MLRVAAILILLAPAALAQGPLVFPVEGEWFAADGPRCEACPPNLAHRLLLVPLDPFGRPAPTCRNGVVLSPTDGAVLAVGTNETYGHHVAIVRGETETVVLGFLAENSAGPAAGDAVAAGEPIARCAGPALHVHMQASRDILDPDAGGLAMPFSDLEVRTPGGCMATTYLYRGEATCAAR